MSAEAHEAIRAAEPDLGPSLRHALVIEDDPAIQKLTAAILRRSGFEVDVASNGLDGLALIAERDGYEIVLLDLTMPVMGGAAVLDRLRESMPAQLRRIIIITAAVHEARRGLPEEVCRVVEKPFDLAELMAAVESCAA